jgi:hypothetical protein
MYIYKIQNSYNNHPHDLSTSIKGVCVRIEKVTRKERPFWSFFGKLPQDTHQLSTDRPIIASCSETGNIPLAHYHITSTIMIPIRRDIGMTTTATTMSWLLLYSFLSILKCTIADVDYPSQSTLNSGIVSASSNNKHNDIKSHNKNNKSESHPASSSSPRRRRRILSIEDFGGTSLFVSWV